MRIEVLLTEAEIAQEFSDSMQARDIPEKFFYWFPLSTQAWLELARDAGYEPLRRIWKQMAEKVDGIVGHFADAVPVLSFGSGEGSKDRLVLARLQTNGREARYFPVDASQSLLECACSAAEDQEIEALGIKADISSPMHLVLASDAAESPRLFLVAGNTMGSFDPLDEIRHIAQCMHEDDRLIIDAELYDENALARTNVEAMRKFAFSPLASVGLTPEDGDFRFEQKHDERHEGLYLVTRQFRAGRDLRATVAGEEIPIERGERVSMNFQYLYTREAFRWLLEEHARLHVLEEIVSPDERFAVAVCSR